MSVNATAVSKPELADRLADAERELAEIARMALAIVVPPRTSIPPGELVPMLRALFATGQRLATENAQLRALLKSML